MHRFRNILASLFLISLLINTTQAAISMEWVEVFNGSALYSTWDAMVTFDTNAHVNEMLVVTDTPGNIYQNLNPGSEQYTEPDPAAFSTDPQLEFDTYVTVKPWPYKTPCAVLSNAVNLGGSGVAKCNNQTVDIAWKPFDGYLSGPGTFQMARLTLTNTAQGTWKYLAFPVYQEGPIINGEPVPEPATLRGDANLDGVVSADDYSSIQAHFGNSGTTGGALLGDANWDGVVAADDFATVQARFGNHLPEPATLGLLLLGGLAMLRRRS